MEIAVIVIGVLTLIPVAYFIIDRYFRTKHKIEIDIENAFFASFDCPNNKLHGKLGLGLYTMKVVNTSNSALTIKELTLNYQIQGQKFDTTSFPLQTGTTPEGKPAAILKHSNNSIILIGWYNLKTEIGNLQCLSPGAVLSASAYFLLEHDITSINEIKHVELLLRDHAGYKSKHKLKVESAWKEYALKGMSIMNVSFKVNDKSDIEFL